MTCDAVPGFIPILQRRSAPEIVLPFTLEQKAPIFIPINKAVATGVILAFFNERHDPLDRIRSLHATSDPQMDSKAGRLLITYYLSCIKYMTDIDLSDIGEMENCDLMIDDLVIVEREQRTSLPNLKSDNRLISPGLIAFHAVYGANVMCRPVTTKKDFNAWVTKRYSAFMASIQQTAEVNFVLDLQKGGNSVNESVLERP
jgi:hypothetical protein